MTAGRKAFVAAGAILVFVAGLLASLGAWHSARIQEQDCVPAGTTPIVTSLDVALELDGLTVKGVTITTEQAKLAATMIGTVWSNRLDNQIAATVISIAIVESTLSNPDDGDATSVGPLQQQEWWGSYEQRKDPIKATTMVIFGGELGSNDYSEPGIVDIPGWKTMSPGLLAAEVQQPRKDLRGEYAIRMAEARAIVAAAERSENQTTSTVLNPSECGEEPVDKIELFTQSALDRVDEPYKAESSLQGVRLLRRSARDADFTLPDSLAGLLALTEKGEGGVTAELIDTTDPSKLERGDLPLLSTDGDDTPDQVGVAVGSLAQVRFSTYNIQVGAGYEARVAKAGQLIRSNQLDVIGLQEVENEAVFNALASKDTLGDQYAIYPPNPSTVFRNSLAARPIIYDKTRFEVTGSTELTFTRMGLDDKVQPAVMPALKLLDTESSQEFYVVNVHYAAFPRYARERKLAGDATAELVKQLQAEGIPVLALGDFNSNTIVRDGPNPTFQGKRENLAYCQLTANGLMNNARDLSEGFTPGSYCPRNEATTVDHIYTTADLTVERGGFGEITGTLTDHGKALYADVGMPSSGGSGNGSYVGVSKDGGSIALRSLGSVKLVGALRLTVSDTLLAGSGEWSLFMAAGTFTYSGNSYGPRVHPITGVLKFHNGMDLGADCGTPLYAMNNGKVKSRSYDDAWGNTIEIDYGGGNSSVYAHMLAYPTDFPVGTTVTSGQKVGEVGDTGLSTACHLHFIAATSPDWRFGDQVGTVDPLYLLEQIGFTVEDLG